MSYELTILAVAAASLGFIHTVIGPDHYVPFIVMAQARKWSMFKTAWITILCGLGHIGSSVLLGMIGIAFGIAVSRLEGLESLRGNIAGWAMIAFGLAYTIWGIRRVIKGRPHTHAHFHLDSETHSHHHTHSHEHTHIHERDGQVNITPWVLFTIFVFGPCEPLIPILMYPAAQGSSFGLILITAIFGAVTILTMLGIVLVSSFGISFLPIAKLEKYTHAIAGITIFICGVSIQFLGL
ncbi:MAG: sulfite exporter TauE/SafE family protein [candidate division Zixibacteria bacterium]|nr:sulfite exporter TauE/SafE family protein [candidate division Zixibacteria bacterium]